MLVSNNSCGTTLSALPSVIRIKFSESHQPQYKALEWHCRLLMLTTYVVDYHFFRAPGQFYLLAQLGCTCCTNNNAIGFVCNFICFIIIHISMETGLFLTDSTTHHQFLHTDSLIITFTLLIHSYNLRIMVQFGPL